MANRYWVGGTDTWNTTAGTKWSTTSGGPGGSAVPASTDDVFFDGNSGVGTVTLTGYTGQLNSNNINFSGYKGTIQGTGFFKCFGNLVMGQGMTNNFTGTIQMVSPLLTDNNVTVKSNGTSFRGQFDINRAGSGGNSAGLRFLDDFRTTSGLRLTKGSVFFGNNNITVPSITFVAGANLVAESSTINYSGDLNLFTIPEGFSVDFGTSTLRLSGSLYGGATDVFWPLESTQYTLTLNNLWIDKPDVDYRIYMYPPNMFSVPEKIQTININNLKVTPGVRLTLGYSDNLHLATPIIVNVNSLDINGNDLTQTEIRSEGNIKSLQLLTAEIVNPGTGYVAMDYPLTVTGKGTGIGVQSVDGNGGVTALDFTEYVGPVLPGEEYDVEGGSGTGLKIRVLTTEPSNFGQINSSSDQIAISKTSLKQIDSSGGATFTNYGGYDSGYNTGWVFVGKNIVDTDRPSIIGVDAVTSNII